MDVIPATLPWRAAPPLAPDLFARVRRQAIFECCKWDPQVEDVATLAPFSLLLSRAAWDEIANAAEALAAEAAAAEAELVRRPELHGLLGLPGAVRRALRRAARDGASAGAARVMRFDFHATPEGWRISEVNSDVPGGFNEASGFTRLMAEHAPGAAPAGDPAARLADAVAAAAAGGTVALVHATAYSDDRQVMVYLGRELAARGVRAVLAGPDHLRWQDGRAALAGAAGEGPAGLVLRFFPAEWLPALPRASGWRHFFHGARTPLSNPAVALLTQSKRFPLVWDRLATALPTWRRLLPETCDPREAGGPAAEAGGDDWVLKPALGRVGDGIGIAGATGAKEWQEIRRGARRRPGDWAAQRRFTAVPLATSEGDVFPCVGVYTVDGRAAGAYGRAARRPLVDHKAQDVAVLIEEVCR
jgi:glutathionylspermidine synthase